MRRLLQIYSQHARVFFFHPSPAEAKEMKLGPNNHMGMFLSTVLFFSHVEDEFRFPLREGLNVT